jgi:cytochrome c553
MRVRFTLTAFLLTHWFSVAVADAAGDASAGVTKAEICTGCHNTPVSLKGRSPDAIADQIYAIRAGERSHPPGLATLSEEDIADIAAYLDTG